MAELGKGRAEAISDADISNLANELKCHPADLEAIAVVESQGFGWFKDGRIKILFEKHWFYKKVPSSKRTAAVRAGVARKEWISPKRGGYRDQSNADARYRLLKKAIDFDREAAFQSVSIGKFQIMGFNFAICGFRSASEMWDAFCDSEANQLRAFANFLKSKKLVQAIRNRDFETVEDIYNGGGLNGKYAVKMRKESDALRRGKWKHWKFGYVEKPPQKPAEPVSSPPPSQPVQKEESAPAGKSGGLWAVIEALLAKLFGK